MTATRERDESKPLPAAQRRARTVAAVLELAAEQHPGEITTTAIAARMHLSQGALFRHFPTKEAVWEAVMAWVAERVMMRLEEAERVTGGPLAALEAIFHAHVDFVVRHPGVPRILFGELQRTDATPAKRLAAALVARYAARVRRLVEAGQAAGEVAPEVEPAAAASLFIGSIQGLVMQSLLAGDVRRLRQAAPGTFALLARGLRRRP